MKLTKGSWSRPERTRRSLSGGAIPSIEALGRVRMDAMKEFLSDYTAGIKEGRYVDASLPSLPFKDGEFDIAMVFSSPFSL